MLLVPFFKQRWNAINSQHLPEMRSSRYGCSRRRVVTPEHVARGEIRGRSAGDDSEDPATLAVPPRGNANGEPAISTDSAFESNLTPLAHCGGARAPSVRRLRDARGHPVDAGSGYGRL